MKTILIDAVDTFVIEGEGIYQPLYELLETYPNRKLILTNANDEQMVIFGLQNMPYELFTLKHAPDKIDPLYFRTMFEHFKLTAEEVVYIEHNPAAVESARSIGINSFHYDEKLKDVEAVKIFLDQNL